ncbi:hypothetical protein P618_200051 [Holospora obtusa F1]|uniref:Transposase n=1 Tax=Holospora obtusa F1 TaxID=1399147 RepID=W6TI98_HOLOB|nr:hypothetical protein P618_200051 [Holospora obtusa F1]
MKKNLIGQLLHANSKQQEGGYREIRNSQESIAKVAVRFNINPKTIIQWRKREDNLPMGA